MPCFKRMDYCSGKSYLTAFLKKNTYCCVREELFILWPLTTVVSFLSCFLAEWFSLLLSTIWPSTSKLILHNISITNFSPLSWVSVLLAVIFALKWAAQRLMVNFFFFSWDPWVLPLILISIKISFPHQRKTACFDLHPLDCVPAKTHDCPFWLWPVMCVWCQSGANWLYYQTSTKDIISILVAASFPRPYFYEVWPISIKSLCRWPCSLKISTLIF